MIQQNFCLFSHFYVYGFFVRIFFLCTDLYGFFHQNLAICSDFCSRGVGHLIVILEMRRRKYNYNHFYYTNMFNICLENQTNYKNTNKHNSISKTGQICNGVCTSALSLQLLLKYNVKFHAGLLIQIACIEKTLCLRHAVCYIILEESKYLPSLVSQSNYQKFKTNESYATVILTDHSILVLMVKCKRKKLFTKI